ncbi:MAG: RNA polymerase sigma-54 factor, partial [Alphaproteobacteria bacterium]
MAHNVRMHESNVSRAIAGKYPATPSSIFLFRYFFDSPFHSILGGNAHSAKAVRYRIKCLIEHETPDTVMSDNRIAS